MYTQQTAVESDISCINHSFWVIVLLKHLEKLFAIDNLTNMKFDIFVIYNFYIEWGMSRHTVVAMSELLVTIYH